MILLTTKEFLEQAMYLDLEIRTKKEEIVKLEGLIDRVNQGLEVESQLSLEGLRAVIGDYSEHLVKDITRLVYLKHSIILKIDGVENCRDRVLLKLRYIDFKTWEQIAEEMEYSERQVQRVHNAILKDISIV